jgi:two-component system, cell cycle response regulator
MDISQAYEQLSATRSLPEPTPFALKLARLCCDESPSPTDCDDLLATGPEFCRELLRFFSGPLGDAKIPCSTPSLHQAVGVLGRPAVAYLAVVFSLVQANRHGKCRRFDYQRFWQKALARGAAAYALAQRHHESGPLFFAYGTLAAIGELAMATAFPEVFDAFLGKGLTPEKSEIREEQLFGMSTTDLTGHLLGLWHLPKTVYQAVKAPILHPASQNPCRITQKTRKILLLADYIAKICLLDLPLAQTFITVEQLAEEQGMKVEEFAPLFDETVPFWQAASEFFEIPSLSCPSYHEIKTMDDISLMVESDKVQPLTVLIADDDPITLICLEKLLQAPHRQLIIARDGREALALALEKHPQLLVTDWHMPGLTGIDLCKILRKTSVTQHTYIIVLTGKESDDELVKAFDAGADDYVTKPFTPKVLQARISSGERLLRSQQTIALDRETIKSYATKLAASNRKLQNMAMTDFLTGLPNRRSALRRLKNLVAEVQRYNEPLSCLMIDIDHFKNINDNHGHDRGDQVLRLIARLLEDRARSYDMVSRWGGEEFLVISARSGVTDTLHLAERLRKAVATLDIILTEGLHLRVTISIGVATWNPAFHNAGELIKKADQALYQAKANGRNRVEAAD